MDAVRMYRFLKAIGWNERHAWNVVFGANYTDLQFRNLVKYQVPSDSAEMESEI